MTGTTLHDDLVRILLDAGVYTEADDDPLLAGAGAVADVILSRLAETTLQGATVPAPDGTEIVTAGEYAAAWNAATPEDRQEHLQRVRSTAATALQCFLEDHGALTELVTYWRSRAHHAEDALATVQAELRSGPEQ